MSYTDAEIAEVVHEANRGLQSVQGDPCPSPPWFGADAETKQSAIEAVHKIRAHGATPRSLHASWCAFKLAHGWRYGPVKDSVEKTHPCLVDYADLPDHQKLKDEVFLALVHVMAANTSMRPGRHRPGQCWCGVIHTPQGVAELNGVSS